MKRRLFYSNFLLILSLGYCAIGDEDFQSSSKVLESKLPNFLEVVKSRERYIRSCMFGCVVGGLLGVYIGSLHKKLHAFQNMSQSHATNMLLKHCDLVCTWKPNLQELLRAAKMVDANLAKNIEQILPSLYSITLSDAMSRIAAVTNTEFLHMVKCQWVNNACRNCYDVCEPLIQNIIFEL